MDISDVDLDVPDVLRPSAMRHLGMRPELDEVVDALPGLHMASAAFLPVTLLRLYRRVRPDVIGNRCVYEPSCSRYSELAFRTKPPAQAIRLTISRLCRCKPGCGGTDMKELEIPS
ncbi:membrane protein insertion efficiency factor YidD [uncultured Hyphomonas sp.]|uniref:membrane protein insertion efficiency factor YidD n=1 Tax=uncultured Hyphomonas sp. TaxID=225298 RepID=UPI000C6564D9|nr:hypothetical protein [Hyphomonadaceae bacterium]MBA28416.1 hypothetical protein [Hyphomonadaceae bacterium]|tara:strand:+ start:133 stop:480 length:348 start_codon:yes stop_codon:yes gene_type:complete